MLTSGIGPATRLSLGAATLIALMVAAMGALHARQADAANGDPVLVYGGSVAGSGAQDVTIAPGGSGNYVVSMTVPSGEDIGGIYVKITYDNTKFSSVSCTTPVTPAAAQFVCNPTANGGTEVRILATDITNPPPAGFGAGTFTLATITFNVAGAAADTANAITNVTIEGCEPVGTPGDTAVTCNESPANLGKLVIGTGGGGGLVGDINCSGTVTAADANLLLAIFLSKPGAAPGGCNPRLDINCNGSVSAADANLVLAIFLQKPNLNIQQTCPPPLAMVPSDSPASPILIGREGSRL